MVEVFKTDISKKKVARMLVKSLSMQYPGYRINIDFADCDKVLRIESFDGLGDISDLDQMLRFVQHQNITIEVLC